MWQNIYKEKYYFVLRCLKNHEALGKDPNIAFKVLGYTFFSKECAVNFSLSISISMCTASSKKKAVLRVEHLPSQH